MIKPSKQNSKNLKQAGACMLHAAHIQILGMSRLKERRNEKRTERVGETEY